MREQQDSEARIQHLAHYDALTGLPNRALLEDRCRVALHGAHRHGQPLALVFLDLDHFKTVNDSLGHRTGDAVLVELARRLQRQVRAQDTVARLGGVAGDVGDEAAVELTEGATMRDPEGAIALMNALYGQGMTCRRRCAARSTRPASAWIGSRSSAWPRAWACARWPKASRRPSS